ncbi:MAG: SDR family NAD(P)-dependent oxidoreductase [Mycobacteriales bacterium]
MMLTGKTAIIYGAGGPIGGAVARAFAREGATVFLAGRTRATLDTVAEEIRADGGEADTAVVDALDAATVDAFVDGVARRTGRVDISFNVIGVGDVQRPLMDLSVEEFVQPIATMMRTQFLTTKAAARHMTGQGSGVVLAFGGSGTQTIPGIGGFKTALDALEGHRRQWAVELGRYGVRFVTLKTGGIPESMPDDFEGRADIVAGLESATLLGRTATLADVGNVAAFVASDLAATMTSATVNVSCGAIVDL